MFRYKQSSLISVKPGINRLSQMYGCIHADLKRFANQGNRVSK